MDVPESINPDRIVCRLIRVGLLIVNYRFQLVVAVGDRILEHDQLRRGQVKSDLHGVSVVIDLLSVGQEGGFHNPPPVRSRLREIDVCDRLHHKTEAECFQFPQVDAFAEQVPILHAEVHKQDEIKFGLFAADELNCLHPRNGAVVVRGGMGHKSVVIDLPNVARLEST